MKISTEHNGENHDRIVLTNKQGVQYQISECSITGGLIINKPNLKDTPNLIVEPRSSISIKVV